LALSRFVAFLSGAMYGMGWFLTTQMDRLPHAAAAAILPLALEFTWRLLVAPNRHVWAVWLAVVVTAMFTTGGTGTAVLGSGLCVAMFGYGLWALDNDTRRKAVRTGAAALAFSVLLT